MKFLIKALFFSLLFLFIFLFPQKEKAYANCSTAPTWTTAGSVDFPTSVQYHFRLKNNCNTTSTFSLTATRPTSGWNYQYSGCSVNTACSVSIGAFATKDIYLTITRPTGATPGNYTITFKASNSLTSATKSAVYIVCATCADKNYQCGSFVNTCGVTLKCGNNGACTNSTYTCSVHSCLSPTPTPTRVPTATPKPTSTPVPTATRAPTPTLLPTVTPIPPPPLPSCGTTPVLGYFGVGGAPVGGLCMLNKIIEIFLNILMITGIVAAIIFLIWGGIDWITSGGDKQKIHSARQKLTFAIVGLVVVFLAFFILNFIKRFFGIG